jgi:hypothetical protein
MHAGWVLPYFYGTAMITGDPDESVDLYQYPLYFFLMKNLM